MIFSETLRLYPAVPILTRVCSHEYQIPGTDNILEKGTSVLLPLFGAQRDPNYYPDPDKFIPDRFSDENKNNMNGVYYPFGEGPRICIGLRMGKMQTKLGLATMMHKYKYELSDKIDRNKLEITPKLFILTAKKEIELKISKR